jgi:UDP-glucose 4-epimerase
VRGKPNSASEVYCSLGATVREWEAAIDGVDGVFHLAWSSVPKTADANPISDIDLNLKGTVTLLEALRSKRSIPIVVASSGGTVYGVPTTIPIAETHPLRPIGIYGASKLAVETYALAYRRQFGVDSRILRLSNPYGPSQNVEGQLGAASVFAWKAVTNQTISIWGDGSTIRDFIYIDDAVNAFAAMMEASPDSFLDIEPILNIGSGRGTSLREIVSAIENKLQKPIPVKFEAKRDFDVPANVLDISLAKRTLDWDAGTSFDDGMGRMLHEFAYAISNKPV